MEDNKKQRYYVNEPSSFYRDMTGPLVFETAKTKVLEFKLNEELGGKQRVQFHNHQVTYVGYY